MTGYTVTLRSKQAIGVGSGPQIGNDAGAHDHVPGWVLQGALAAAAIRERGREWVTSDEFAEFIEGSVRFGPLYQDGSSRVPLSASQAKTPDAIFVDHVFHPSGSTPPGEQPSRGQVLGVVGAHRTNVALEADGRGRESAMDGALFSRHYLAAHHRYSGHIRGRNAILDEMVGRDLVVWLGGKRTVAGRCLLRLEYCTSLPEPPTDKQFVVRLISPAIFADDFGRPLLVPASADLCRWAGASDGDIEIVRSWVRPGRVGGWHGPSGMPKPEERVAVAGSTYLVRAERPAEAFAALFQRGLGLRTREGFGAIDAASGSWSARETPTVIGDDADEYDVHVRRFRQEFTSARIRRQSVEWMREARSSEDSPAVVLSSIEDRPRFAALAATQREFIRQCIELPADELDDLIIIFSNEARKSSE